MLQSVSDLVVEMWAKSLSEFNAKYPGGINYPGYAGFMPTLCHNHENFGKSTTIFSEIFIKTHLRVNKHFWRKFCISVLFNSSFPFSIKIPVKYNTVLLVVN